MKHIFTKSDVIHALKSWLEYGEQNTTHGGYFSGAGWAATVLRSHIEALESGPSEYVNGGWTEHDDIPNFHAVHCMPETPIVVRRKDGKWFSHPGLPPLPPIPSSDIKESR